jgi:hypothetical protein
MKPEQKKGREPVFDKADYRTNALIDEPQNVLFR